MRRYIRNDIKPGEYQVYDEDGQHFSKKCKEKGLVITLIRPSIKPWVYVTLKEKEDGLTKVDQKIKDLERDIAELKKERLKEKKETFDDTLWYGAISSISKYILVKDCTKEQWIFLELNSGYGATGYHKTKKEAVESFKEVFPNHLIYSGKTLAELAMKIGL